MIENQHIIICLKDKTKEDPATYVQPTRRRFNLEDALVRMQGISPERKPVIVAVPYVELDENNYPLNV